MPKAGQSAGGQPPRRSSARLQPEVRPADIFAFVGEVLEQFDACGETTVEETREADRAQARLARLGCDAELYERLAKQNFTGIEYELFRAELAAYALPVLRSFIRRKMIYPMCQQARRPVSATDTIREHLAATSTTGWNWRARPSPVACDCSSATPCTATGSTSSTVSTASSGRPLDRREVLSTAQFSRTRHRRQLDLAAGLGEQLQVGLAQRRGRLGPTVPH